MSFFSNITHELSLFSFGEIIKAFAPLFVTIDILGAIPIVLSLKDRGQKFSAAQVGMYSCLVLLCFLVIGEPLLDKLGVDISSFGVAGGIILFVMAAEMVFGIQIFREDGPTANATFIPLVFPLFAGAAAFTTILTLQGQGIAMVNVAMSVILNMVVVYLGLRFVDPIERMLGKNGAYILRKFFGVILLAISVKFIANSLIAVIATVRTGVEAAMQ
ncbi:MAG: MarC family protein [Porphyromonadaceae bacterium]|nr:MarC family protein [Porphyromonadaceae bacterium]